MSTFPTDAERNDAAGALRKSRLTWGTHSDRWGDTPWQRDFWGEAADTTLDALAPFVADRERAAAARALRKAQHAWQTGEWTALTEAAKRPEQVQRILGAAQAVTEWLRDRADEMEAGEGRG